MGGIAKPGPCSAPLTSPGAAGREAFGGISAVILKAAGGLALPHQQDRAGFVLSARFHDNKR